MTRKKKSSFKNKVTTDAKKQRTQGSNYGHLSLPKNVRVFKEEPDSKVKMDIMPYEVTDSNHPDRDDDIEKAIPGALWYKRPFRLHRNVGVNNDSKVCPTSIGKKCPVCDYRAQLLRDGADYKDDTVRALKASLRNLYVVIPKDSKDYKEEPHIWDISQYLFQDKLNEELDENEDFGVFPDLEEGLTLRIRFSKGQIGKNEFAETSRIDFDQRDEPYDEDILKSIPNLDEILIVPSYKQLETEFFELTDEQEPEEDIQEEEESKEKQSNRKKKSNKPAKKEPEPEDERSGPKEEESGPEDERSVPKEEESGPEEKKSKGKQSKKESKSKCPYNHKFGDDCEEYDDCDDCDMWEDCIEEKERNE